MNRRQLVQNLLVSAALVALSSRVLATDEPGHNGLVRDARLTAPLKAPASGSIRVAFLISSNAEVVDFTGPWGVFNYVMVGGPSRPFSLYTVAVSTDPVTVSGGMTIVPNHSFADAPEPHIVVVPAMDLETLAPGALNWLRSVYRGADVTMSVCNGSYVLGQAGLLDGRSATAHHNGYAGLQAMFPKVKLVRGVRYVEDGKIATAGGLTSGTDLALRVVERYFGRDVAKQTALRLEYQGTGWMYPRSNAVFAKKPVSTTNRPLCPVCQMEVERKTAPSGQYRDKTYYFCGESCKKSFLANPTRFVRAK
jgi:Transcriptional regulator containing an amidase domain and an AraC-type DNA-binding HTH domain